MHIPVLLAGEDHRSACLCWSTTSGWCYGASLASSALTAQNWEGRTGRQRVNFSITNLLPFHGPVNKIGKCYDPWESSRAPPQVQHQPVVTNGCKPGNVQHQRGVQWAWLGRLALWWRRAFMTQHAGASHPPQLGALPWLLHKKCHSWIFSYFHLHYPFIVRFIIDNLLFYKLIAICDQFVSHSLIHSLIKLFLIHFLLCSFSSKLPQWLNLNSPFFHQLEGEII